MEIEQLSDTKPNREYYVHLLVGITETRHCLATLREYVLSVWQDGDRSGRIQPAQWLLAEQFELQQRTFQDDTQLVSNCLESLKHKVISWDREMQLHSKGRSEKVVTEDEKNENCTNNNNKLFSRTPLKNMDKHCFSSTINDENTISPHLYTDDTGFLNGNQAIEELQQQVKDLLWQLESQRDQMNTLLRANQNYKDDYRNKVRSLNRNMAIKMAAMNRAVMEAMDEGSSNTNPCNKYDHLLRRITSLSSQLSEKKKEVQTLKTVVNYNRCSSENRLKKLQDELDEYKEKTELTKSVHPSSSEDGWKEFSDLQTNLTTLEQENTNLRHLLSLEVTQKLQLLNKHNQKFLDRRQSLPGKLEYDTPLENHIMYPMRRQQAIHLV